MFLGDSQSSNTVMWKEVQSTLGQVGPSPSSLGVQGLGSSWRGQAVLSPHPAAAWPFMLP